MTPRTALELLADQHSADTRSPAALDPWARPRLILEGIAHALRLSISGQVLLGQELAHLKKDMGFNRGSNIGGPVGQFVRPDKTWPDLIQENLGISSKTADRMIDCFDAAKARLKKISAQGTLPAGAAHLEILFTTRPAELTAADRETLARCVDKLVDGETQASLLKELKISKFHVPLTGGDTSMHKPERPSDQELMGQLAFKFFHPVAEALQAFRRNTGREAFLHTISITSTEEGEISLTGLERDLEAALHDVRAAKKSRMKPVINA